MSSKALTQMQSLALPPARYAYVGADDGQESPIDPKMPVWRYLDLAKLLSLLETRALYFSRGDLLGDPFEGSITADRLALRRSSESKRRKNGKPAMLTSHS